MTAPDRPTPPPSGAAVAELLAWLDACEDADDFNSRGAAVTWARVEDVVTPRPAHAAATLRGLLAEVEALRADARDHDETMDAALTGLREPMTLDDARRVRAMLARCYNERRKAAVRARRTPSAP